MAVNVPVDWPAHRVGEPAALTDTGVGSLTVLLPIAVQPLASVTVTV